MEEIEIEDGQLDDIITEDNVDTIEIKDLHHFDEMVTADETVKTNDDQVNKITYTESADVEDAASEVIVIKDADNEVTDMLDEANAADNTATASHDMVSNPGVVKIRDDQLDQTITAEENNKSLLCNNETKRVQANQHVSTQCSKAMLLLRIFLVTNVTLSLTYLFLPLATYVFKLRTYFRCINFYLCRVIA